MPSGIVIIDKPAGWTSMDVCAKLRGILKERRVGHGGTLDPIATGVLPVFAGTATRAVEFAEKGDKEYIAGLRLGMVTNTQDSAGEVLEERAVSVGREELEAVLPRFTGPIEQVPPMFSAIKRNGKKLYELARKGQEVHRDPRPVTIHALEVLERSGPDRFLLRVRCSKGTYVRTLCHDIGQALGCGGCMDQLRRTMAAGVTNSLGDRSKVTIAGANPRSRLRSMARRSRAWWPRWTPSKKPRAITRFLLFSIHRQLHPHPRPAGKGGGGGGGPVPGAALRHRRASAARKADRHLPAGPTYDKPGSRLPAAGPRLSTCISVYSKFSSETLAQARAAYDWHRLFMVSRFPDTPAPPHLPAGPTYDKPGSRLPAAGPRLRGLRRPGGGGGQKVGNHRLRAGNHRDLHAAVFDVFHLHFCVLQIFFRNPCPGARRL